MYAMHDCEEKQKYYAGGVVLAQQESITAQETLVTRMFLKG